MKKFNANKNTVAQVVFIAPKAYKRAIELINEFNGTLTSKPKEPIVALFKSKAKAQKFIDQFEVEYAAAHEAYEATKVAEAPKKAEPKKKAPSSPKKTKGNGKMSLNDFVVSKPNCSRKEAEAFGFKGTREDLRVLKRTLGVR